MRIDEIIYVFLVLLLILIIFLFGAHFYTIRKWSTERELEFSSIDENINSNAFMNVILEETEDAGWEYINKIYFVGDSTTYHFYKGGIDPSHILVPKSLTLTLNSDIINIAVGSKDLTISQAIKDANAEIVIITLGVNGANNFTENRYKTYYNKLIDAIKKDSPSTLIIIQSIFPVTESFDNNSNTGITNECINKLNMWAKEIAFEKNCRYLDTQSILKNKNGAQYDYYNVQDGVHMNEKAYEAIIYYIRTHAIK